jgi:hypothetical protein
MTRLNTWSGLNKIKREAQSIWLKFPIKYLQGVQNVNATGDFITHSKDVYQSYLIRECENLRYVQYSQVPSSKDCMDSSLIGSNSELFYETAVCGWGGSNLKFCWECWDDVHDLEYCIYCSHGAKNLFGCAGVGKREYCILNKQYTKEEYESLVPKIKKHMDDVPYVDSGGRIYKYGEFFPPEASPFAYNQTITPEHSSFTKDEAVHFGARWQDISPQEYETTMRADEIPDDIEGLTESISKEIIRCVECNKAYRIIPSELQFLKHIKIPAPRSCVDCRHTERILQRNKAVFYKRKCMCKQPTTDDKQLTTEGGTTINRMQQNTYKNTAIHAHGDAPCPNEFETSYSPDRPEIIYCETCYQNEVS